jgi:predicted ester cyclase
MDLQHKQEVFMHNKELIQNYCKRLWEQRDLSAIDDTFAENAMIKSPFGQKRGIMTMREIADKWLTAFPDLFLKWEGFVAEGDKVVCRWRASGTHLGGFFETSPTHKEIYFSGVWFYTIKQDKIVDFWSLVDMHALLVQLEEFEHVSEALD